MTYTPNKYWTVENLIALHDKLQTVPSYDYHQIRHIEAQIRNIAKSQLTDDDLGQLIEKTDPKRGEFSYRSGYYYEHFETYHKPFDYNGRSFVVVTIQRMREGVTYEGFLGLFSKRLDMWVAESWTEIKETHS